MTVKGYYDYVIARLEPVTDLDFRRGGMCAELDVSEFLIELVFVNY